MRNPGFNLADAERVLEERKTQLRELSTRRDAAQKELDKIESEIDGLLGPGRSIDSVRRKRRRAKNDRSLRSVVLEVLKGTKPGFSLKDLADKVTATGYKTTSRNFRNVLYQCLYNTEGIVHDDGTGRYLLSK